MAIALGRYRDILEFEVDKIFLVRNNASELFDVVKMCRILFALALEKREVAELVN